LRQFFQRLQAGLPLTSSEKLNAVHSKLGDFCRSAAKHNFFKEKVSFPNTRYAHFDVVAKAAAIEVEGLDAGLRFEDLKETFEAQLNFSKSSAVARRIRAALDFLDRAFSTKSENLRSRSVAQSLITLTCKLITTHHASGSEQELRRFFDDFTLELAKQVELGQAATDSDYVTFQRSVSTNLKSGPKTRHEVLLRKLLAKSPKLAAAFEPTVIAESGTTGRIAKLGVSITSLIHTANKAYEAQHGDDLFKPTNNTVNALTRIGRPISGLDGYKELMDDLYFLFRESIGQRLGGDLPVSFVDVNTLRTEIRHDVDHGEPGKVRNKRKKTGATFAKYAGAAGTPETVEPSLLVLAQANLLAAIERDLSTIVNAVTQPTAPNA